jgi:hypothetical protein
MPKPILIALTNAIPVERDDEFNRWYNEIHAKDILSLPTVSSITRYRSLQQIRPHMGEPTHRYLAIYEMDDPERAVSALIEARPRFQMCDALADPVAISFTPIFSDKAR